MTAARSSSLEELIAKLGPRLERADLLAPPVLPLGWAELDAALPDGGLPRGVVELTSPSALGGATSIGLAAVRAAHARDARGWCAWIDPDGTLFGPGALRAGVDLSRLLVVRPPREELGRIAVKIAASGAFDVIVIDVDAVPGLRVSPSASGSKKRRAYAPEVLVRKLALAAEEGGATILLLTDASAPRPVPWPVALRLELSRPTPADLTLRVAKDRRGRSGIKKTIPFSSRHAAG